jgi:hypothetical protein
MTDNNHIQEKSLTILGRIRDLIKKYRIFAPTMRLYNPGKPSRQRIQFLREID